MSTLLICLALAPPGSAACPWSLWAAGGEEGVAAAEAEGGVGLVGAGAVGDGLAESGALR